MRNVVYTVIGTHEHPTSAVPTLGGKRSFPAQPPLGLPESRVPKQYRKSCCPPFPDHMTFKLGRPAFLDNFLSPPPNIPASIDDRLNGGAITSHSDAGSCRKVDLSLSYLSWQTVSHKLTKHRLTWLTQKPRNATLLGGFNRSQHSHSSGGWKYLRAFGASNLGSEWFASCVGCIPATHRQNTVKIRLCIYISFVNGSCLYTCPSTLDGSPNKDSQPEMTGNCQPEVATSSFKIHWL